MMQLLVICALKHWQILQAIKSKLSGRNKRILLDLTILSKLAMTLV